MVGTLDLTRGQVMVREEMALRGFRTEQSGMQSILENPWWHISFDPKLAFYRIRIPKTEDLYLFQGARAYPTKRPSGVLVSFKLMHFSFKDFKLVLCGPLGLSV